MTAAGTISQNTVEGGMDVSFLAGPRDATPPGRGADATPGAQQARPVRPM